MEKTINVKERKGFALALSGGGFRATLFHLGLLRRLNEIDLLQHVDAVSSVSGGSITNALLAKTESIWKQGRCSTDEWDRLVRDPLVEFCGHNIRTLPVLKSLVPFSGKGVAVREVEKVYAHYLNSQTLGDLPETTDFIFCASDLIFSTMWYFRRKTSQSRRTGNFRAGYVKDWESIPIARAVAASSCFPPVFGPQVVGLSPSDFLKPSAADLNWSDFVSKLRLTDGGVYDNLGLQPVWDIHKYLISSDGGKPSVYKSTQGFGQLMRFSDVIQGQVANLRRRMLIERDTNKAIDFQACYLGIHKGDKPSGYSGVFARDVIANIRTDLDVFSEVEARVLENHCYLLADYYIKKYLIDDTFTLPYDASALNAAVIPWSDEMDEAYVREALKDSGKRTLLFFTRPGFL